MSFKYTALDEEGFWQTADGLRVLDADYGRALFENLHVEDHLFVTSYGEHKILVEAFDAPFVARHVERKGSRFLVDLPYDYKVEFEADSLSLDEWDRFHARVAANVNAGLSASNNLSTTGGPSVNAGLPIVFSRTAQMELFDLFDSFDDESIVVDGKRIMLPTHLPSDGQVARPDFWSEKYVDWKTTGEKPGWDLANAPACLRSVMPQLKIPKSRIAVVGSGAGHDVNFFYELGHIVTGLDFSSDAVAKARELYPENDHRKFLQVDALNIPADLVGQFDIVFEHTFFCAIDPSRRAEAVRSYSRLLHEGGHLLGVFMIVDKMVGPPFGSTEWELRARLKKNFEALYWTRWRHSDSKRVGRELVVYARKVAR